MNTKQPLSELQVYLLIMQRKVQQKHHCQKS